MTTVTDYDAMVKLNKFHACIIWIQGDEYLGLTKYSEGFVTGMMKIYCNTLSNSQVKSVEPYTAMLLSMVSAEAREEGMRHGHTMIGGRCAPQKQLYMFNFSNDFRDVTLEEIERVNLNPALGAALHDQSLLYDIRYKALYME